MDAGEVDAEGLVEAELDAHEPHAGGREARARRYRPAAIGGRRAIATAAAWALLAALWAAALAHALARLFPPVDVALPAGIGALVGGGLAMAVRRLRLSRPRPTAAIAAGAAVLALLVQLALDFRAARDDRAAQLDRVLDARAKAGLAAREQLAEERDAYLEGWTPWRYGLARIGLDDSGTFSGTPPVLGRAGTIALSAFQLALALLIAGAWSVRAAREPACPRCGAWRAQAPLGSAAHGVAGLVVVRLMAGDAEAAAGLLRPPDTREQVMFSLLACPAGHDRDGGVLRIGEVFWTRHRRLALRRVADLEVSGGAVAAIAAALRAERGA